MKFVDCALIGGFPQKSHKFQMTFRPNFFAKSTQLTHLMVPQKLEQKKTTPSCRSMTLKSPQKYLENMLCDWFVTGVTT